MESTQPAATVEAPRWTCAVCGALSATAAARFCSRCGEPKRPERECDPLPALPDGVTPDPGARRHPVLLTAGIGGALVLLVAVLAMPAWQADRSPPGSASMAGAGPQHTSHFPGPSPALDEIAWGVLVGPPGSATTWRLEQERGNFGYGMYRMGWSPQLIDAKGAYYADDKELIAVDGDTGTSRWRFALEPDGSGSSIVLAGPDTPERPSRVVVGGGSSTVGLDTETGAVQWHRETATSVRDTHVVAAGSRVLVHEVRDIGLSIVVLEAETGAELWTVDVPQRFSIWAPVADEETVLLVTQDADGTMLLRALEAADGSERWVIRTGESWPEVHAVRDGRIYLRHWRWEREVVSSTTTGTATTTETVVEVDVGEHHVAVIDASTGRGLWETTIRAEPYGGNGIGLGTKHLYLSGPLGLRAHDASSGEIVWERSDGRWWVTGTGRGGDDLHAWRLDDEIAGLDSRGMNQAVRSGRIFEIHALDPATGASLWHRDHATRDPWPIDIALAGYGRSYISHPGGRSIHDSATGEVTGWHLTRSPDECAPIVTGEAVIVPGVDALYSVDQRDPDPPRPLRRLAFHESATGATAARDLFAALVVDTAPTIIETRLYTDWGMLEPAAVFPGRPAGPPVINDRSIYLAGSFRWDNVMKLHPRTGSTRWRTRVTGTPVASPTVSAGHVHVATDGGLITLDADSGDDVWTVEIDRLHGRAPVRVGRIVLVSTDSRVVAVDADSGEVRWEAEVNGQVGHGIASAHGRAYVATADGLVALSLASGEQSWTTPLDAPPTTGPVVSRGQVVVATGSEILALDGATGRVRSALDAGAFLVGDLVIADGTVYACSMEGALLAIR